METQSGHFELRRLLRKFAIVVAFLGVVPVSVGANLKTDVTGGAPMIFLSGEIDARTPEQLAETLKRIQPKMDEFISDAEQMSPSEKGQLATLYGPILFLDSGGGDVFAAIRTGEIARSHHVSVWISRDGTCASACVLVLCGGVERLVAGRVGIHRPYASTYSESLSESDQRYKAITAAVDKYLREMNMPARLVEAMNTVPPEQIRWLNSTELTDFGLGEDDPVWKDRRDSVDARARGISKQDYYERIQRGRELCREVQGQAWAKCYYDIVGFPK